MSDHRFIMGGMPDNDYHEAVTQSAAPARLAAVKMASIDYDPVGRLYSVMDGGFIERYHIKGQRMLTRQSVAEHSWRMIAIVFAITEKPSTELLLATAFHDVSERVTGDVPANVKRHNPAIQQAVNEVSTAEEVRLGIRFDLTTDEEQLLSWADRYEGALHCWDEYELGNRKIVQTLLRYHSYCSQPDYKLADARLENNRRMLMTDLNSKIDRIHREHIR